MLHKLSRVIIVLMLATLLLSACGTAETPTVINTPVPPAATDTSAPLPATATVAPLATDTPAPPPATTTTAATATTAGAADATPDTSVLIAAAQAVALQAAGGQKIGGTVDMMGVLGGNEQDAFLGVLKPFEDATGISVQYESTRDLAAVLQTRVEGGNPPDVVSNSGVGQMAAYAAQGKLIDLGQILDMAAVKQNYDQDLLTSATSDGKLWGIYDAVNLEGLIWYNPKTYKGPNPPASWADLQSWAQQTAAGGTTPWCIGLESGAASGWPGTTWLTELVLKMAGPDKYDQWWQGKLAWSSPEIKAAFAEWGKIATDAKMVTGGPTAVLATNFASAGDAMYAQPPQCYLHEQASFFGGILSGNKPELKPVEDINFFAFPDIDPAYPGQRQISGEVVAMFKDTPQARALLKYIASPAAATLMATTGIWVTPNKGVPATAYPSVLIRQSAQVVTSAQGIHYDGSALMPQQMVDAFYKAVLNYVQNPDQLDAILANLDSVQQEAYK